MDRKRNTLTLKSWNDESPVFELDAKKATNGTNIPGGSYKLKEGKLPLLDEDLFDNSNKYHTLVSLDGNNEYKIKVTGFNNGCNSEDNHHLYGGCNVHFEDLESNGGRRRPSKKRATPRRRSSKSRKARSTRRK